MSCKALWVFIAHGQQTTLYCLGILVSGAENANNVRLETLKKKLPRLQERDQSRGRFGGAGGGGGRGDRSGGGGSGGGGKFSGGRSGRGGFSDRVNDRFSRGGRGRYNSKKW